MPAPCHGQTGWPSRLGSGICRVLGDRPLRLALGLVLAAGGSLAAEIPATGRLWPNLADNVARPLRYHPDHGDFVIENGPEFFNRPLYGGNTAFRVDGGDRPEFVLYLPGRGGNLRFGIHSAAGALWLHDAVHIVTRYRPGELLYEIRDPLLGPDGALSLAVLAYDRTEGLLVRIEATKIAPGLELVWAFGGINGERGSRDGDIGTERVPISQYFQLQPVFCQDNVFELAADSFTLRAKAATVTGLVPGGSRLVLRDAGKWNDLPALLESGEPGLSAGPKVAGPPERPVLVGQAPLANGQSCLISLQRLSEKGDAADELSTYKEVTTDRPGLDRGPARPLLPPVFTAADLPRIFAETGAHFTALRQRVSVETPDAYLNAAVGALNIAADAVWDEPQQAIMHGAVAWRTKLLGWRGPYALDALGWHDRARANLAFWAGRQNTAPIPEKIPPPDAGANLARSETALHSNGDISNSHYDMNTVFIDGLFRHLLWTGDLEFAKEMWPVIERHLAWERRLFRREFTSAHGEKLPLYEAYAVIWASDDLQYSGGGAAHSSAYNYWHNRMAARLAPLAGADPAPYAREADLIARAMRQLLWVDGHFAEYKDWLGLQLVHPSAALWTFYHTIDSAVPTPREAGQMARYVDDQLPHLPVSGPGVPDGLHVLATSNWMPYTWSINNVTMNENAHAALGFWQAGRPEEAFRILKGALLASMFMGISPGNVGTMNYLDVYRRESQRDFADGSGTLSRALVEGLFGVRPDGIAGTLLISPGFPSEWNHAALHHPDIDLTWRRENREEIFTIDSRFARNLAINLDVTARGDSAIVTSNGDKMAWRLIGEKGSAKRLKVTGTPGFKHAEIRIVWSGPSPATGPAARASAHPWPRPSGWEGEAPPTVARPQTVDLTRFFNDRVTAIFRPGKYLSPRSPFVSLAIPTQGIGHWAGHVSASADIDDAGLRRLAGENHGRFLLPDGLPFATPGPGGAPNVLFVSQWDNYPKEATVPLSGKARGLHLLMAGSTNAMQSRLDNGEVVVTYADGTISRLALRNPETWWPIEQDYFTDDFQFRIDGPLPTRVNLKTGEVRVLDPVAFKGKGRVIPGGAATVLGLALDPDKELHSLTVRALANDVVIGLMAVTLAR